MELNGKTIDYVCGKNKISPEKTKLMWKKMMSFNEILLQKYSLPEDMNIYIEKTREYNELLMKQLK